MRKLYSFNLTIGCLVILLGFSYKTEAQIPTNQDCLGAIPVCQSTYIQPNSYVGDGNYHDEIGPQIGCPNNCMDHELNSVWYVISVKTAGLLRFVITPVSSQDDYDWAVYNLNEHDCSQIRTGALLMMSSCNAAGGPGYQGATGISSAHGGTTHCRNGGNTNKWNADLPVEVGDTYVLCVSNWTSTQSGYTLDFSASTADIFDDVPAFITAIDTVRGCSGSASIDFDFNENILCTSVQAADFIVNGPDGDHYVDVVAGAGCLAGGTQEKFFSLSSFTPPITVSGTYTLTMVGEVEDLCHNTAICPPIDFYADMDPIPAVTAGPDDQMVPIGSPAVFHVETVGADTYRWQVRIGGGFWTNLNEVAPYSGTTTNTLTINPCTFDLGQNQYRCVVSGPCTPAAQSPGATLFVGDALAASASASPEVICIGGSSTLSVDAIGGNVSQAYTYLWTDPYGWSSPLETISVEPTQTTTYTVVVDDGYNPVTVQVTVYVNPLPVISAGEDQSIFHGTQASLTGSVPSGTPPYLFNWQPSDSLWNNTVQNPTTRKLRGSTIFTLIVTDDNGCVSVPDVMTVSIIGGPLSASPMAQPSTICLNDTARLYALPSGGDTASYTYSWTVNGNEFSTQSRPYVTPTQTTTYSLLLDDGSNQINRTVTVNVNPLPVIQLIKPEYYVENGIVQACVFDSLVLDPGYLNATYLWNNGASTFTNTIATSGISFDLQKHVVKVTDINTGCVNIDSVGVAFTFTACSYGIPEKNLEELVKVYPNPAQNSVNVMIDGGPDKYIAEISDLTGRVILSQNINKTNTGIYNHLIGLSRISNSTCLIRISSAKGSIVRKLIIAK
ncbi:MAG: T9SS type A sorting domain-containing protein [Chloroflexota bacterium]|nr:T9SS type A sorting domain-containing protein [Lentimicrobium sp.]